MIAFTRGNKQGRPFRLVEVIGKSATSIRTTDAQIVVNYYIRDIANGWHSWIMGAKIQDAFPFMTTEERRFLQRGGS
jgi:hypothetical protein